MSVETVSDPHKNIYLYSSSSYYSRYADITVLKINSSGEVLSNYKWGGQYNDACNNLEIDSQDNLYMICRSEYRDQWGLNFYRNILVKNPKPDGKPPVLDMRFSYFDEFLLSFMGIMSVVSIFTLFSIIIKKSKGKLPK